MSNRLTIKEASAKLNLKVSTLYKMTCQKRIPYVKISSKLLFDEKSLDRWIEEHSIAPITTKTGA